MIGAAPVKGTTTQWGVMETSPATHAVLHPHGGKHYRLWSRLHEGQHQFIALPVAQEPKEAQLGVKGGVHEALQPVLVQAVKDHARLNYENGWDGIVECYEDKDILEAIDGATTIRGAINALGRRVRLQESLRRDVEGEIF